MATNRLIPFLENCWGSAELSSVCHMLSIGDKNKGHGENVKNFVTWSELGNVNKNHAKILSRLKDLRSLRYDLFFEPINDDLQEILKNVKEMMEDAEKLI